MTPNRFGDLNAAHAHMKRLAETADYIRARALRLPKSEWPTTFEKASVAVMSGLDPTALVAQAAAFKETVIAPSILAQLPALQVQPNRPIPTETSEPTAYWTEEGGTRPVTRINFTSATLTDRSISIILPITRELLRLADATARNVLLALCRRQMVRALDTALLGALSATAARPAGLLAGVAGLAGGSPISASSLEELIAVVSDGRPSRPVFVTSPRGVGFLAGQEGNTFRDVKLTGGMILGAPQLVSPAAGDSLVLIDAQEVAVHDGPLEIDSADQADLQMSDSPSAGAAAMVSMFQTDSVAVRMTLYTSWATLSDDPVGYLELPIGGSPA